MFKDFELRDKYTRRREVVFIVLSGLFLGSLAMLNIVGISKQIDFSFTIFGLHIPVLLFVGILPYPITFLCTDFISELYGKKRANTVVWVGLIINIWVLIILWVGGIAPSPPHVPAESHAAFDRIKELAFGATTASMIAYLTAQFVDVRIFHFLKKQTKGKHLWLRNNVSTLVSQLIDTISVVLITYYYAHAIDIPEGQSVVNTLMIFIYSGYIFKMLAALLDTIPFYIGVKILSKYLDINPVKEFEKAE